MLTEPLTIIYHQPWLTGEVPGAWKVAKAIPSYKKTDRGSGELQACETELGNPKCLLPTLKMLCFDKPIISCRHLWFRKKFVLFKRTSLNISYPYMKVKVSQEVPSRH